MSDVVAELKPLLEQLIDLVKGHDKRLGRLEAGQAELIGRVGKLEAGQAKLEAGQAELIGRVGKLETGQEEIIGRLGRLEQLTDVAEIRGRVEEQSKFLQLALAARQPRKPAA